jgi:signal transduction histidine kinase/CheY-like chemotaxis protein/ligand-binding sensor domain-containing protein
MVSAGYADKNLRMKSAVVLILCAASASAWVESSLRPTQYIVDGWGAKQGLPEEMIARMVQSPDGYLWLASANGLIRFDGLDFQILHPSTVNPGRPTRVLDAVVDSDGSVVFLVGGHGLFRMRQGTMSLIRPESDAAPYRTLFAGLPALLAADPTGGAPVFVDGSRLFRVGPDGLWIWRELPEGVRVAAISYSRQGWLVAARDGRFFVVPHEPQPLIEVPVKGIPRAIVAAPDGTIWLGTTSGVIRYELRGGQYVALDRFAEEYPIRQFLVERADKVWIASETGLLVWRGQNVEKFNPTPRFQSASIGTLFRDREGNVWVSLSDGELFRIKKPRFPSWGESERISSRVMSLDESAGKSLWVGAERGLYRIEDGRIEEIPGPWTEINPRLMLRDRTGKVLVLSLSGMAEVDEATLQWRRIRLPNVRGNWILLFRDGGGNVWVGNVDAGLFLLKEGRLEPVPMAGLPALRPRATLMETTKRELYLSNRGDGLYRLAAGKAIAVARDDPASSWIHSALADSEDNLWLGFDGGGIGRLRNGKLERFALNQQALENVVFQIAEDDRGYLWLGLRAGLIRVAKRDLARVLERGEGDLPRTLYDVGGGLLSANFGLAFNVIHQGPAREFWLAHLKGLLHIDAARIPKNELPPPVNIRSVLADGKPLPVRGGKVRVASGVEHLRISFDAPSLSNPGAVRYRYQLVGFQDQPVGPVAEREASFLKLPPGDYRFRVWARNGDDVWNESGAALDLYAQPSLTETAAFKVFLAICAIAFVVLVIAARTRWLRWEKHMLEDRVRRRTAELEQARLDAEAAVRTKAEFLAMMSHEIRTPLHGVLGTLEMLSARHLDRAVREDVATAKRSGELLLTLLNDVLDLSRLDADRMELQVAPFSLRQLMTSVADAFRHRAQLKGIRLVVEYPEGIADCFAGDEARVRQILYNLTGNAVKFTERGQVTISLSGKQCEGANWEICFAVSDTGIGIAPDVLPRLFQPFTQVDTSATRRFGGSGLGLAISQRLAVLMGGELTAEGEEGRGSTFRLRLMVAASHEPRVVPESAPLDGDGQFPAKVLLVEDNRVNQLVAKRMLEHLGCEVDFAGDGLQALEQSLVRTYDLILMDFHMPNMDGIEAAKRIRAGVSPNTNTPIVALTASNSSEDRRLCLDAGMQSIIGKPCRRADLAAALRQFIRRDTTLS